MNCFAPLTYSIYLDDELPRHERLQVERHLAGCLRCTQLVEELRREAGLLRQSLSELDPVLEDAIFALRRSALEFAMVMMLVTFAGLWGSWLSNLQVPSGLSWLDPTSPSGALNLMFQTSFFLRDVPSLWEEYINLIAWLLAAVAIVGIATWVMPSRFLRARKLVLAMLLVGLSLPVTAIETRKGGGTVVIRAGETIDDTLLVRAQSARIEGTVNGDLIVFAQHVDIRGQVKGDVISWAQRTDVRGTVEGNVYSFSQNLGVSGQIVKNAYSWAQNARVDKGGRVGGTLVSGSAEVGVDGDIGRDLYVFANSAEVAGVLGRDLRFRGGKLRVLDGGRITGDVKVRVRRDNDVQIEPGAQIGGKVEKSLVIRKSRFARSSFYFWRLVFLAAGFLVGWVLLKLLPAFFNGAVAQLGSAWRSLGLGFAVLVCAPIVALVLAATLIGIPLGLMLLAIYMIATYLAHIFVGAFIGSRLLHRPANLAASASTLLLGLFVVAVMTEIPYVGVPIKLVVTCFGLGAFAWQFASTIRQRPA